jgi:hypothetical protein
LDNNKIIVLKRKFTPIVSGKPDPIASIRYETLNGIIIAVIKISSLTPAGCRKLASQPRSPVA